MGCAEEVSPWSTALPEQGVWAATTTMTPVLYAGLLALHITPTLEICLKIYKMATCMVCAMGVPRLFPSYMVDNVPWEVPFQLVLFGGR